MTYKRPESVLVVIVTDAGQALVLRRLDDANFWQSVTGSLEGDELPFDTAIREVKEETGIDIIAQQLNLVDLQHQVRYEINPLWRHRYAPNVSINLEHQFLLELPTQCEIQLTEHSEYAWLPFSQAVERISSASNRQVIIDLANKIGD